MSAKSTYIFSVFALGIATGFSPQRREGAKIIILVVQKVKDAEEFCIRVRDTKGRRGSFAHSVNLASVFDKLRLTMIERQWAKNGTPL